MSVLTRRRRDRGAASVEHAGLVALLALTLIAALAVLGSREPGSAERSVGSTIARKLRCAATGPGPCWRDPLTGAYGRPLAGWVRAVAPLPLALAGPGGEALTAVDFRRCRIARCAVPSSRPGLTASNRRVTAFVSVVDRRRSSGAVRADFWLYRPTIGWERVSRRGDGAAVAAASATPLLEEAVPRLVPLETLAGRNHVDFRAGEEPPWRWLVESGG